MSARLDTSLDFYSKAFLITANWMEIAHEPRVMIIDMDLEDGGLSLYGSPADTEPFKKELMSIMRGIIDPKETEHWRL